MASIPMTLTISKKTNIEAGITQVVFNYVYIFYEEKYKVVW